MSAPRTKLSAIFAGSVAGLLAVVILLMVPVLGVRKQISLVILDWQELVLYLSCLVAGTIAGARLGIRDWQSANSIMLPELLTQQNVEVADNLEVVAEGAELNRSVSAAPAIANQNILEPDSLSRSDEIVDSPGIAPFDSEPPSTVPQIEESLAGGPKKPPRKFWTEASKARTRVLLLFLYLLLYVMCAILCQKLNLGSIATDFLTAEIIRNIGLGLSVTGLYLMIRGMFVKVAPTKSSLVKTEDSDLKIGGWTPHLSPHVPPTRLEFLRAHPVCGGWLVLLTGLPLVFLAWFPLIAIPGVFIGMNWLFVERNPVGGDIASMV